MVGATGFEPAAPCAQGKPERALEVLFSERFAVSEIREPNLGPPERQLVVTLRDERQRLAVRAHHHIVGQ
jgi:hypothetical protein